MAPVVRELATLPEADVRAIAHLPRVVQCRRGRRGGGRARRRRGRRAPRRKRCRRAPRSASSRIACGACHHDGDGPVELGRNLPLALYSSLHSSRPDNLLRAVLEGIRAPATRRARFHAGVPRRARTIDNWPNSRPTCAGASRRTGRRGTSSRRQPRASGRRRHREVTIEARVGGAGERTGAVTSSDHLLIV